MNLRAVSWLVASLFLGVGGMFLWDRLCPPQVAWLSDWTGARERARESGRPVLALFEDPAFPQDAVLAERAVLDVLNFRVVPLRPAPGEERDAMAERLGVETLPAWRLLDADGRELSRRDGVLGAGQFLDWLKGPVAPPEGFTPP